MMSDRVLDFTLQGAMLTLEFGKVVLKRHVHLLLCSTTNKRD
jgi:hypothetical protein